MIRKDLKVDCWWHLFLYYVLGGIFKLQRTNNFVICNRLNKVEVIIRLPSCLTEGRSGLQASGVNQNQGIDCCHSYSCFHCTFTFQFSLGHELGGLQSPGRMFLFSRAQPAWHQSLLDPITYSKVKDSGLTNAGRVLGKKSCSTCEWEWGADRVSVCNKFTGQGTVLSWGRGLN